MAVNEPYTDFGLAIDLLKKYLIYYFFYFLLKTFSFSFFFLDLANRLEIAVSDSKTIIEMNKQIEEELQNFQHTFEGKLLNSGKKNLYF